MASFFNGAAAMAYLAGGTFFVRFWRESEDRFFLCLAVGFWTFAVNYALIGILPSGDERRTYAFALRLVGLVAILTGVLLKNRELPESLELDRDQE